MKKSSLILAGLALVCAAPAFADNTDTKTVTVSGSVVASLDIAVTTNVTMPDVVKKSGISGNDSATPSVTLACDSAGAQTVTYANNGNPFAGGNAGAGYSVTSGSVNTGNKTGTCAKLTVTGQTGYTFLATLGTPATLSTGIAMTAPTCTSSTSTSISAPTAVVLAGGSVDLYCGLTVAADENASTVAAYSGSFTVTATYD